MFKGPKTFKESNHLNNLLLRGLNQTSNVTTICIDPKRPGDLKLSSLLLIFMLGPKDKLRKI